MISNTDMPMNSEYDQKESTMPLKKIENLECTEKSNKYVKKRQTSRFST